MARVGSGAETKTRQAEWQAYNGRAGFSVGMIQGFKAFECARLTGSIVGNKVGNIV